MIEFGVKNIQEIPECAWVIFNVDDNQWYERWQLCAAFVKGKVYPALLSSLLLSLHPVYQTPNNSGSLTLERSSSASKKIPNIITQRLATHHLFEGQ